MINNNTIILLSFAAAFLKIALAGYVYHKNHKAKINLIFALIFFSQGIWDLGKALMWLASTKNTALLFGKISYAAYILSVFLFAHFCWVYLKRKNFFSKSKLGLLVWYTPMIFLIISLFTTPLVISDLSFPGEIDLGFNLELWMYQYGPFYNNFFLVFQMLPFLYGFIIFIAKYIRSTDADFRKRLLYLIVGSGIPILIGIPTGVVLPAIGIRLPPHNNILTLIMAILIGIGIIKYKLLSIKPTLETVNKKIKFSEDIKKSNLNYGSSYLIENPESHETAFQFFLFNLFKGNYGFILTSQNPEHLKEKYKLVNTPISWITDHETDESSFGPNDLEQIYSTVENFVLTVKNSFILVDCLDILKDHNNFHKIQYFLRRLNGLAKETGACIIVPRGDLKLSKKEKIVFKSEFTYITGKGKMASLTGSIIDLYEKSPGKEKYIILGYTNVSKSLINEYLHRKIPCTVVSTKHIMRKYHSSITFINKNPLIKSNIMQLKIDNPNTNVIITFDSDADTILGINMVRHITEKAKVLVKVNTDKFIDIAKKAGANEVIASSALGGKLLSLSLTYPNIVEWFMDTITSRNKSLDLTEILINEKSPLKGKTIIEIDKIFGDVANVLSVSKKSTFDLTTNDHYKVRETDKLIVLVHRDRLKQNPKLNSLFNS
tara:strand:+ start:921 stop:2903 length:1983 start_codon:yes stop_codon:yes gene_type:complete